MTLEAVRGRRDRRKAETRQRLLRAALASFASRGYAATTMDQIAEDADVARSTLFNYFRRKEDLIFDGLAAHVRSLIETAIADCRARDADTVTTLYEVVRRATEWYDADPRPRAALVRAALEAGGPLSPLWFAAAPMFADVLRDGRRRGEVPARVDPDRAARSLLDCYLGAVVRWAQDEHRGSLTEELAAIIALYLDGVLAA